MASLGLDFNLPISFKNYVTYVEDQQNPPPLLWLTIKQFLQRHCTHPCRAPGKIILSTQWISITQLVFLPQKIRLDLSQVEFCEKALGLTTATPTHHPQLTNFRLKSLKGPLLSCFWGGAKSQRPTTFSKKLTGISKMGQ